MRKYWTIPAIVVVAALGLSARAALYMTVTAAKQGAIKGDVAAKDHKDAIAVVGFSMEIDSQHDAGSGQLTGRRTHLPLVITKEVDASSPKLFQAMATNEVLTNVTLELVKSALAGGPGGAAGPETFYKITLTNANIVSLKNFAAPDAAGRAAGQPLEEISFTYQKIEVESLPAGGSSSDSWQAR